MGKVTLALAFVAGLAAGFFALFLWGRFTSYPAVSWGLSLLSPGGGQVVVFGFRIKHWMVGVALVACGTVLVPFKRLSGMFLLGVGAALIVDEI